MADLPSLEVRNVTEQKHSNAADNLKYSGFHITISTNKRPTSTEMAQDLGGKLNKAIALTFTHQGLSQFIMFLHKPAPGGPLLSNPNHNYKSNIKDIDVQYAIELGQTARGGRIHAHVVLKVTHNSYIRINIPVLKKLLIEQLNASGEGLGIQNLYINVGTIRGDKNLEEYLLKKQVEVKDIGKEKIDSGDKEVDAQALAKDMKTLTIQ